jgi:hypothetical protein
MVYEELEAKGAKAITTPRIDLWAASYLEAGAIEKMSPKSKGKYLKDAGFTNTGFRTAGKAQSYIYLLDQVIGATETQVREWANQTNDLFKGG